MLQDKHILLGVTGGIAAYKTAELVRMFLSRGAKVKAVMTANAEYFVTPTTLETVTGDRVYRDTFQPSGDRDIAHISLVQWADAAVVAPATANMVAKVAAGIADDLLSTVMVAIKKPVLICPAMNTDMFTNPIFHDNLERLKSVGYRIMDPASGDLACKTQGTGRLPPLDDIVEAVEALLSKQDLRDIPVLVTAGPTQEPLDPVRYITNHSTGKMGYAMARAARQRGARVTLISGPVSMPAPSDVGVVQVMTAVEMRDALMEHLEENRVVIKAAAVSDYRPREASSSKMKKTEPARTVDLVRNPDIISEAGARKGDRIIVGFAMETGDLVENARNKLLSKNMDIIVANDLNEPGAGFRHDTNVVKILDPSGGIEELPLLNKMDVAHRILDRVVYLLEGRETP